MISSVLLFRVRGHALAVFIIALAVLARLAMGHFLGTTAPFVTLYPATILIVLIGRPVEALTAIAAGGISAALLFIDISNTGHLLTLAIYCLSGIFLTIIAKRLGRAKAQQARHVIETRFQAVYDTSMDGIFVSNPKTGEIISANPAACAMLGMTEAEIRQAGRDTIVVQEEKLARGFTQRPLRGTWRGELTFRRKDGSTFPVDVSSSFFTGPEGEILSSTIVRDITERKQTEESLSQGREDLARAQEVGQIGSWRLNIQDNILTWSDESYRLFGVSPGTPMTYEMFLDIVHPGDREYVNTQWNAGLKGEPYDIEHRIIADGREKWVREKAYLEFNEEGQLLGGFGITQDVTDRKRAEEELRKARDELEMRVRERTEEVRRQANLLELTHDAIFVRDMEGHITFWNKGAEETYACSREFARGKVSHNLLQTRFPKDLKELEAELLVKGRWEGELKQTGCDGRRVTVLSRWAVQSEGGKATGVLEINSDITKYKAAQDQLRQGQKLEALGTMAGGIAHDFNNMLAAIIGFGELIYDHLPGESHDRRHARSILKAALRGRDLVKQMLTFSRKTDEEDRKPLQLSSIVKETAKMLRASIPATIAIRVNVKSESGAILGEPVQIQQAIMNLILNAAHAMRETGGAIDIELSDFTAGQSNTHSIEPGVYLKLEVRDTGTGISPDLVDKIFDPFFTTKKSGEGTGLGLSVVMGIVKQAHGHITVESEPGKGSVFIVYFPMVSEELIAVEAGEEPIPIGRETILLVEDAEPLVEMEEEVLEELGYHIISRTSSLQALALFQLDPSRFDLVITDQTMADLTGIDMSREMMAIRPDIPIVLATGYSDLIDADRAKAVGIKEFVMKPLTKRELARIVRKVLDQSKGA